MGKAIKKDGLQTVGWVYILGKAYEVRLKSTPIEDDDSKLLAGISDVDNMYIDLYAVYPYRQQAATFCHELKHVMDYAYSRGGHSEEEEDCARSTEAGLVSFLGDPRNDKILEWARKGLRGQD